MRLLKYLMARANQVSYTVLIILTIDIAQVLCFFSAVQPLSNSEIIEVLSNSPTMEQMRNCFEALRRSLSRSKNPPVDEIIQSGLLGALVQALKVEVD